MRLFIVEKIMKMLDIEPKSDNYQKIYRIVDMVFKNASDNDLLGEVFKRKLLNPEKCKICNKNKEYLYSDNGVFDLALCSNEDLAGKHK